MATEQHNMCYHLERKDGEGEDDDGGDCCRNDHGVRVILHAHLCQQYEIYKEERFLKNYHAQDDPLCYCEGCQQNEVDWEAPEKIQLKLPHSRCGIINVTIFDPKTNISNGSLLNVSDGVD